MRIINYILISLIAFTTTALSTNCFGVEPSQFVKAFMEIEGEFSQTEIDGIVHYHLKLIPAELRVISSVKKGVFDEQMAEEFLTRSKARLDFILQIQIPENGHQEFLKFESDTISYEEKVEYYAFDFQENIKVIIDGDVTSRVSDYIFERNYGSSPKGTFSFSIPYEIGDKNIEIKIDDKVYGSKENTFSFETKSIKKLPRLKKVKKWINQ